MTTESLPFASDVAGRTALHFDNRFVRELPGDPETSNRRRQVLGACWSAVTPTPVVAPRLLAHAREVADLVGFTPDDIASETFAQVFGGNALYDGMQPYAACYGGHQFGAWAGQLGDGRAITLGEVVNDVGERWELQLKGAGPTPYSRTADGRAVLRSSLREFLCSEAMHHLGVPTTRALSLVGTGEPVVRDMLYDGNARAEPGAIVCRVAPSFIRFGNFEILAARDDHELLARLVDFTIARDFPHLLVAHPDDGSATDAMRADATQARRAAWFRDVCERSARLVVEWMRVGFVHGVMNTDNMSILGLTIDYGPYGWLEEFDPHWTPNTTDAAGRRYRYGQQPAIVQWNLVRLAEALRPVFSAPEPLEAGLDAFLAVYDAAYERTMAAKFGFAVVDDHAQTLMREGFGLLYDVKADFTRFFRALGDLPAVLPPEAAPRALLGDVFYGDAVDAHAERLGLWLRRWHAGVSAMGEGPSARRARMHAVNPQYVLRNWMAQEAIDLAEQGDLSRVHELLDIVRRPYETQPGRERYDANRPDWARHKPGCSMLSCSS
jgi:uncharacterized protein YdiU (UPF0061 family)